jgi:glycine cleavage system regulatory protein
VEFRHLDSRRKIIAKMACPATLGCQRPIVMKSRKSLVVTVLGVDHPGLIDSLASVIADHGGNWVESRLSRLAGQFAGVLRVAVAAGRAEVQERALRENRDLNIGIGPSDAAGEEVPGHAVLLELVGPDRPGIVREISHAIASLNINVEELETECTSAPWSGERLFKATARLALPGGTEESLDQLRSDLERIAQELTLEIDLIERSPVR